MAGEAVITEEPLDDVFSKAEPEIVEPEVTGEEAPEETATAVEPETPKEESTPDSEDTPTMVPLKAVKDERRKRQEAEARLAALEEAKEKPEPTSVFENEADFRQEIVSDVTNQLTNQALNQSQFYAEREFGEVAVAEKIEVFKELAQANPALAQQFSQAISPYHELVKIVNQHEELKRMENIVLS